MNYSWFLVATVLLSYLLTGVLRRYALSRSLLDVPNSRSSHTVVTPRGGGVAIVVTLLLAVALAIPTEQVSAPLGLSLLGAGGLVAIVGFLDDHGHIAARWRLLAHFASALVALLCLGGLGPIAVGSFILEPALLRNVLALFFLAWMINLYNFMDGIDGLASVEAITSSCGMCLLFLLSGHSELITAPLLLALSVLGFLIWNFPPARIFMGDAGSGFLGLAVGVLAVHSSWTDPSFFWAWSILLGVFVVDATYTLIRRLFRGAKVYEAHRSHAYQFAARKFGAHLPVTLGVCLINLLWLLPIAAAVVLLGLDGFLGAVIAYLPLVFLAVRFRAGGEERG
jgi:Fuc2NAc and GlcNAc transferase